MARALEDRGFESALAPLAAAGVQRAIFGLPAAPRDEVLTKLDAYAAVMRA